MRRVALGHLGLCVISIRNFFDCSRVKKLRALVILMTIHAQHRADLIESDRYLQSLIKFYDWTGWVVIFLFIKLNATAVKWLTWSSRALHSSIAPVKNESSFRALSRSNWINIGSCELTVHARWNYLSMAIAISVNTEAQILRLATNCDILQNSVPKGQFEFSMYTKLSVVFNVETIASAIDRFTAEEDKKYENCDTQARMFTLYRPMK